MAPTVSSKMSGVAPKKPTSCGVNSSANATSTTISTVVSQKPCEKAWLAPSRSPAPRRAPATVDTPTANALPSATFNNSIDMMMDTHARPCEPSPFPMMMPSMMTMMIWASMPMKAMELYFTNSLGMGRVPSSRSSPPAVAATSSAIVSSSLSMVSTRRRCGAHVRYHRFPACATRGEGLVSVNGRCNGITGFTSEDYRHVQPFTGRHDPPFAPGGPQPRAHRGRRAGTTRDG